MPRPTEAPRSRTAPPAAMPMIAGIGKPPELPPPPAAAVVPGIPEEVTGDAVEVVALGAGGAEVVGLAVVVLAVVALAVVGLAVVGLAVVGLAVVVPVE